MARIDIPDGDGDELVRMWGVNPTMGAAAATFSIEAYAGTRLPVRTREFVRMKIAQINDCGI